MEVIVGLLKNFSELQKKDLGLWLYGCRNGLASSSSLKRTLLAWELWPGWASKPHQ